MTNQTIKEAIDDLKESEFDTPQVNSVKGCVLVEEEKLYHYINTNHKRQRMIERLLSMNKIAVGALEKQIKWLNMLEKQARQQAKNNRGRFDSLADACDADAKNYKATAAHLEKALKQLSLENKMEK